MGYTFNVRPQSKAAFVNECIAELRYHYHKVIDHSVRGGELWIILQRKEDQDPIIVVYVLVKQDGCWGYRGIAEAEHPYYFDCPLKFLAKVPVQNPQWREKVQAFQGEKAANRPNQRLKVGDEFEFPGQNGVFKVVETLGRKGYAVTKGGQTYRLPCRQASSVKILAGAV